MQTKSPAKAILLLVSLGIIWGSGFSLARFATTNGVNPMGYAFWQSLGPAIFTFSLYFFKNRRFPLSKEYLRYYLVCGLLGIAIPNTNMYFSAPHLPSGLLGVLVNTVPIITYCLALLTKQERFQSGRIMGVALGFTGIMCIVLPQANLPSVTMIPWAFTTLITPLCFATCAVYAAAFRPKNADSMNLSAGMLICSTLLLTPLILKTGNFYPLTAPFNTADWVIILEMILSSIGYIVLFQLLKVAGPVYYSLVGGVVVLTGLSWGKIAFGETLNAWTFVATFLILFGIYMVTLWQPSKQTQKEEKTALDSAT